MVWWSSRRRPYRDAGCHRPAGVHRRPSVVPPVVDVPVRPEPGVLQHRPHPTRLDLIPAVQHGQRADERRAERRHVTHPASGQPTRHVLSDRRPRTVQHVDSRPVPHRRRHLGVETVDADAQVGRAFGLADTGRAVVRRRLILEDDRPVELADSYYPESVAAGTPLADNRKIKGGAVRVLTNLGLAPHQVSEHVTARRPTDHEQELLDIPADEPLLVLTRISRAATGQPVEYAVMRTVTSRSTGHTYQMQVSPA
ncbi:GntR family transcriptional regulator [Micromonospora sp. LOL_014]|uniref:GntR family transcriptional regulator n=1 Tax=Micromonospora sp. LOL_014 TaxID=3345415 RepID=UPI003A84A4F3